MKTLKWSDLAKQDLEEVFNFYLLKNPAVAARIHDSILDEAEKLIGWPEIGRIETSLDKFMLEFSFRSLVVSGGLYKIIYFIDGEDVVISRILCCRKNPANFRTF